LTAKSKNGHPDCVGCPLNPKKIAKTGEKQTRNGLVVEKCFDSTAKDARGKVEVAFLSEA
jgi:hypothetical protein